MYNALCINHRLFWAISGRSRLLQIAQWVRESSLSVDRSDSGLERCILMWSTRMISILDICPTQSYLALLFHIAYRVRKNYFTNVTTANGVEWNFHHYLIFKDGFRYHLLAANLSQSSGTAPSSLLSPGLIVLPCPLTWILLIFRSLRSKHLPQRSGRHKFRHFLQNVYSMSDVFRLLHHMPLHVMKKPETFCLASLSPFSLVPLSTLPI